MAGIAYSVEHRAKALELYVEEGPDIAAEKTGVATRTIYRWASAAGVSTTAVSERTQAATSAAKERAAMVRSEMYALLVEQAVKALHSMDELQPHVVTVIEGRTRTETYEMIPADAADKKNLALTAAVLIDKFRLEGGEPTARSETRSLTDGYNDHEKQKLRDFIDSIVAEPGDSASDSEGAGAEVRQPATA